MDSPTMPPPAAATLNRALARNIDALQERRAAEARRATLQDRVADAVTRFTGSMAFVCLHLLVYAAWVVANVGVVPGLKPFDPSFVILATEASVEAIFLSTFVLISQNRAAATADRRADLDLHINLLAEHELTKLTELVTALATRLGVAAAADPAIAEVMRDVAPEAVLDELDARQPDQDQARSG